MARVAGLYLYLLVGFCFFVFLFLFFWVCFFYTNSIFVKIISWNVTHVLERKGNVLFNDALNTFYIWLSGFGHMVKNHSDSVRKNTLPPIHGLLFFISSKASFKCIIPQTG